MHYFKFPFFLFLTSLFLHASLAEIVCEDLPHDVCAFSISSSGKRCLVETSVDEDYDVKYECRTSEVVVERMAGYIESDKCVRDCGVDRNAVGISSDSLHEPQFAAKLCDPACSNNCPNIVDLFYNLAAGEGVLLPDLCAAQRNNPRRSLVYDFEDALDSIDESPPGPYLGEFSDMTPNPEEALGYDSSEDSVLGPSYEEALAPKSSEESYFASAPTPSPFGDLVSTSISAPSPTPFGALISDLASGSAPTPTLMG